MQSSSLGRPKSTLLAPTKADVASARSRLAPERRRGSRRTLGFRCQTYSPLPKANVTRCCVHHSRTDSRLTSARKSFATAPHDPFGTRQAVLTDKSLIGLCEPQRYGAGKLPKAGRRVY